MSRRGHDLDQETSIDRRDVPYLESLSVKSLLKTFQLFKVPLLFRACNLIRFGRRGSLTSGSFHVRVKTCHTLCSTARIADLALLKLDGILKHAADGVAT